jgi:hypothetical protein
MGPTIILDKSALQRLSHDELRRLSCHYIVVAPPVLIYELLGDLSKDQARPEKSEGLVIFLSRNLRVAMPKVCADTRGMVLGNLLGYPVPLDGRIPISRGVPVVDREGKRGWAIDEAPEMEAAFRWHLVHIPAIPATDSGLKAAGDSGARLPPDRSAATQWFFI